MRHLVELDGVGLAPTTGYLARRFDISGTRVRDAIRSLKRRGFLVPKNPGRLVKISRRGREIFKGGCND